MDAMNGASPSSPSSSYAGLDVDKMDYLCRDQLYTKIKPPGGAFCTSADVDCLLQHARVAVSRSRTEIAYLLPEGLTPSDGPLEGQHAGAAHVPTGSAVHLLEGLFRARATMHELCYQCECVSHSACCAICLSAYPAWSWCARNISDFRKIFH